MRDARKKLLNPSQTNEDKRVFIQANSKQTRKLI